jgi:hypothetical protein
VNYEEEGYSNGFAALAEKLLLIFALR